jgi:hypothetical protein
MEKRPSIPEQAEANFDARLDQAGNQLDILQSRGYDMKKIGEIIRLIDYLRDKAHGKKVDLPEPDAELVQYLKNPGTPDEHFAQMIYGIIPVALSNYSLSRAVAMLENFLEVAVDNSKPEQKT